MRIAWIGILAASCASTPADGGSGRMEQTAVVYIAADYDAVWAKLTTAEEFVGWYAMGGIAFPHVVGAELEWGPPGRVMMRGVLHSLDKGRGFAHSFRFRGLGFDDEPESEVSWDVVQQGPVVLVRVRHTAKDAPETMAMIGELGWAKCLNRLKTLLETGKAMPWPADEPVEPRPEPERSEPATIEPAGAGPSD
jgi:uncharacterized protein YndB with AHSA1/START domain